MVKANIEQTVKVDVEDLDDFLMDLEKQLGIRFIGDEPMLTQTIGKKHTFTIADLVKTSVEKMDLVPSLDCTTQQVFYSLRTFFMQEKGISKQDIRPDSDLEILLPRTERKAIIAEIESKLGVKANILTVKGWLGATIALCFVVGIIYLFVDIKIGISLILAGWLLGKIKGNELGPKNLGDLSKKIAHQNYRTLRDRKGSYNPKEIEHTIMQTIDDSFGYGRDEINLQTQIVW